MPKAITKKLGKQFGSIDPAQWIITTNEYLCPLQKCCEIKRFSNNMEHSKKEKLYH